MASVDITIVYTVEVPELDEVELDTPEEQEIISDIYDDWGYYIDRDGYEAHCEDVNY